VRILKEPKNALTKQYAKLFGLEDVKITFTKRRWWRSLARRSSAAPAHAGFAPSSKKFSWK